MSKGIGLRKLLLGTPLGDREEEQEIKEELNEHLLGLLDLIPKSYGESDACKQAVIEVGRVVEMDSVACKRAMLLYALYAEKEVCDYWRSSQTDGSSNLARDLKSRVLPFTCPRFFKNSCQAPETFVLLSMVMSEMWQGETLGNWPSIE